MTIGNVNAGDPLDPAWGDAVADLLNGATATSFTPALGGSGWAIGNGTASGRYVVIAGRCFFALIVTFGTTSTFGAGAPTISLPVTANSTWIGTEANTWQGIGIDSSAGSAQSQLRAVSSSTTVFGVYNQGASGTYVAPVAVTSSAPFTWASGDSIRFMGSYFV